MSFGIYIHWPYCLSKCPYCDFYKEVKKDVPQEEIVATYLQDLDFYHQWTADREVTSIFFGGGTPSLIKPQNLEKIINHIYTRWKTADQVEISLEANPNSNYPQMFADLQKAGINRLSLGVQALNDDDLRFLGRTHNLSDAKMAIEEVLKHFDNHSVDLIYARPKQRLLDWKRELKQLLSRGFRHLSLYQLTIEEGTVFARRGIVPLDEEMAAEMYLQTEQLLAEYNYQKYEVSNYARPGFESRHNLLYWQGDDYLGIGKSAAGRITTGKENRQFYATTDRQQMEELTAPERAEELLLMGLRLRTGISKQRFEKQCGIELDHFINISKRNELVAQGLLIDEGQSLRASQPGFLLLNFLISELVNQ